MHQRRSTQICVLTEDAVVPCLRVSLRGIRGSGKEWEKPVSAAFLVRGGVELVLLSMVLPLFDLASRAAGILVRTDYQRSYALADDKDL